MKTFFYIIKGYKDDDLELRLSQLLQSSPPRMYSLVLSRSRSRSRISRSLSRCSLSLSFSRSFSCCSRSRSLSRSLSALAATAAARWAWPEDKDRHNKHTGFIHTHTTHKVSAGWTRIPLDIRTKGVPTNHNPGQIQSQEYSYIYHFSQNHECKRPSRVHYSAAAFSCIYYDILQTSQL